MKWKWIYINLFISSLILSSEVLKCKYQTIKFKSAKFKKYIYLYFSVRIQRLDSKECSHLDLYCCKLRYSRLSLSRSRRDPLKHFEISVLRHIRCAELRKIPIKQPNFTNEHVLWLLYLEMYVENIVEKGRNRSWGAISHLIHNILLPDVRIDVKQGSDFLFEISSYSR